MYKDKKCIANVFIRFKKLKGCVKTQTGKKSVMPGEWFVPLTDSLEFQYLGYANPLFSVIENLKWNRNESI